jgi:hypothetical protein
MNGAAAHLRLVFDPFFPWWLLAVLAVLFLALLARRLVERRAGSFWRLLVLAAFLVALANPWMVEEMREPLKDVAVVAVDRTESEAVTKRLPQVEEARKALLDRLKAMPDLEVREVTVEGQSDTRLRPALTEAMRDIGPERLAATFVISDGQIADDTLPEDILSAPVHGLIAGKPGEFDRRIEMKDAPQYAIVGRPLELVARIVEDGKKDGATVPVKLLLDGKEVVSRELPVGEDIGITVPIDRPGPMTVELAVADGRNEVSTINNHAAMIVNGIRERLRVLLITGEPYPGARTWRDILKSDGSVDLVHFTILRPPLKQDFTPVDELSLIAFPTYELFQQKLRDFDLIIFDRYAWQGILPLQYLANVVRYVELGGAVVSVAGPDFAGENSIFSTPLGEILPAMPTGSVYEEGFRPAITATGLKHPITRGLTENGKTPQWGSWYRQIDARTRRGTVLMSGVNSRPLLVVDRVGKGRVAELLSDESWLWARGHDGGGPQSEMLRRLAHWLMKEPELEEETIEAKPTATGFDITRHSIGDIGESLSVERPDGSTVTLPYAERKDGVGRASLAVTAPGLYRFKDGDVETVAAFGPLQSPELNHLVATATPLTELAGRAGGGIAWLGRDGMPQIREVHGNAPLSGKGWLGVKRRDASLSTGLRQTPLVPGWMYLLLIGGGLLMAWYREGRPV